MISPVAAATELGTLHALAQLRRPGCRAPQRRGPAARLRNRAAGGGSNRGSRRPLARTHAPLTRKNSGPQLNGMRVRLANSAKPAMWSVAAMASAHVSLKGLLQAAGGGGSMGE